MTLNLVLCASAALFVFGLGAALLRRSLIGIMVGLELAAGGLVLLSSAVFNLAGAEPSTGQVAGVALVAFAVAAAAIVVALHLAAARASRRAEDLEPW